MKDMYLTLDISRIAYRHVKPNESFLASMCQREKTVKGITSSALRDAGDPVWFYIGQQYSENGADELVYLDITASF